MGRRLDLWLRDPPVGGELLRTVLRHRHDAKALVKNIPFAGPLLRRLWRARPRSTPAPAKLPEKFVALYLARNGLTSLEHIEDPVKALHARFALSTVDRGRVVMQRLAEHTSLRGRRCLDVGCAYGGFLVAYAEAGAREVVGIDVNPKLLDYARALTEDYGTRATIQHLDVLSEDRVAELGRFDVITMNDVIEHVRDPRRALEHLSHLLGDGGTLYMEIPNRHSAHFVLADGHFNRFGLTVLPKKEADEYFRQSDPGNVNDVTYRSLSYYLHHLKRLGLEVTLLDRLPADVDARLRKIDETFTECEARAKQSIPGVDEATRRAVERRVHRLARGFRSAHRRWQSLRSEDPKAAAELATKILRANGLDFWALCAKKRSA